MYFKPGVMTKDQAFGLISNVVESIHEQLAGGKYPFIQTRTMCYGPTIIHTLGGARGDVVPEIIIGKDEDPGESFLNVISAYRRFCEDRGELFVGRLGKEFMRFLANNGWEVDPSADPGMYVRHLDTEHFLHGAGISLRYFYTQEQREKLQVVQLITSDKHGRFPWEDGFADKQPLIFEDRGFGKAIPFERTPEQKARATYQH